MTERQLLICLLFFLEKLYPSKSSSVPVSSARHSSASKSFCFSRLVKRLIRASRLIASDLVSCTSRYTSSSGPRPRYISPLFHCDAVPAVLRYHLSIRYRDFRPHILRYMYSFFQIHSLSVFRIFLLQILLIVHLLFLRIHLLFLSLLIFYVLCYFSHFITVFFILIFSFCSMLFASILSGVYKLAFSVS